MTTLETDIITAYSKYSGIFFILTQNKHSVTHDNPSSEHSVTGTWLSVTWDDVGLCEGASVTVSKGDLSSTEKCPFLRSQ